MIKPSMPCHAKAKKAYRGDALLSHFEWVFLSLCKAQKKKKKPEAVVDAAEYGYPPCSAAQQIKVEHESSQVQQLHILLERKPRRQAHSERVLLSELCFTYTWIHHHVCKTRCVATNEYSSVCLPMCCVVCQEIVIDSHYFKGLGFRGFKPISSLSLSLSLSSPRWTCSV